MFAARPDVLNHSLETVIRPQRAVRPSAGYARSLSLLARSHAAGLSAKSGLMVGLGESTDEVHAALRDLRGVGIVTIGQYLRPTSHYLPMARFWAPSEFDDLRAYGLTLGLVHVEASPLTRSSYTPAPLRPPPSADHSSRYRFGRNHELVVVAEAVDPARTAAPVEGRHHLRADHVDVAALERGDGGPDARHGSPRDLAVWPFDA